MTDYSVINDVAVISNPIDYFKEIKDNLLGLLHNDLINMIVDYTDMSSFVIDTVLSDYFLLDINIRSDYGKYLLIRLGKSRLLCKTYSHEIQIVTVNKEHILGDCKKMTDINLLIMMLSGISVMDCQCRLYNSIVAFHAIKANKMIMEKKELISSYKIPIQKILSLEKGLGAMYANNYCEFSSRMVPMSENNILRLRRGLPTARAMLWYSGYYEDYDKGQ